MRTAFFASATAACLGCCAILSCNTADPSAISEGQKALAEAMAKNLHQEEEIAGLKVELKEAKIANSKLDEATAKLEEIAKKLEQVATKTPPPKPVEPAVS